MAQRTTETCPEGTDAFHLGVWRAAIKALKADGLWVDELSPLLREYVRALQSADWAWRNDKPSVHDRDAKRASALADQLALTPRGRKAVGLGGGEESEDPFARFGQEDELAKRRHG